MPSSAEIHILLRLPLDHVDSIEELVRASANPSRRSMRARARADREAIGSVPRSEPARQNAILQVQGESRQLDECDEQELQHPDREQRSL